jgi:hypothetical protein
MKKYTSVYFPNGDDITSVRRQLFERDGINHYATIGFFMQWFAAVEMMIDSFLVWGSGQTDFPAYAHLMRNVLPRVKLERMRNIFSDNEVIIGPNLKARLDHFEGPILKVRNHLAHCLITHNKKTDMIKLISLSDQIQTERGNDAHAPFSIHALHLFEQGAFLNALSADMKTVKRPPMRTHKLTIEIDAPKSRLPMARPKSHPPSGDGANADRPPPESGE